MESRLCGIGLVMVLAAASWCGENIPSAESASARHGSGDLNADGAVNVLDLQLMIDVVLGIENDPTIKSRADLDGDGMVNAVDLQTLINLILGLRTKTFPIIASATSNPSTLQNPGCRPRESASGPRHGDARRGRVARAARRWAVPVGCDRSWSIRTLG